ncbi:MAG: hypothetical protein IKB70_03335 [Bacilli bacterium]|nr:hypothetical protein [Bacilli bacterium]
MANQKNIEKHKFKKGEYSEAQRKGSEMSHNRAKTLKEIRQWATENLSKYDKKEKTTLYETLFRKMEQLAKQGNIKAIEMLLNYSGLKPIDKVEQTSVNISMPEKADVKELKRINKELFGEDY